MKRAALISIFLLCFAWTSYAVQEYAKPEAAKAISNGSIYSLCQDGEGAIWMNTNYGLCRFNGNRLDYFHPQLPRRLMDYDGAGNIYVPAFNGILKVDTNSGASTLLHADGLEYKESVVLSFPDRLVVAHKNHIFFSASDSLKLVCTLDSDEKITALKRSPTGVLLASTASGHIFDISEPASPLCVYDAGDEISAMFSDSHKRIWVGLSNGGVLALSKDFYHLRTYRQSSMKPIRNARTFCEDLSGNIYIGSMDGLSVVTPSGECRSTEEYCPAGHAVCQVITDRDDNVWIGTFYDGVFLCEADNSPFRTIPNPGLRLINAMVEDRSGTVWVFTDHYGLWKYTDEKGFSLVPGTENRKFKSAWYDSHSGLIWAGEYFSRLSSLDPFKGKWTEYESKSGIFDITGRRGELFLATGSGVYVFNPSVETAVSRKIEGYDAHVHSVSFDASGVLWIGGNRLMRYTQASGLETFPEVTQFSGLYCRRDGAVFASTIGKGVFGLKDGMTSFFDKQHVGLQDDYTFLVEEVSDDLLLIGTDIGLSLVDISDRVCCNFNPANGLKMNSTREGDILHRSNGEIWIGGVDGLVALDRDCLPFPIKRNLISFEAISVEGRQLWPLGSLGGRKTVELLNGRNKQVVITLSDFNYSRILPSSYAYRMLGRDTEWTDLPESQTIDYPELKPGRYTLEVRDVYFPEMKVARIEIVVPRMWYSTPWAIVMYCISGCFLALVLFQLYRLRRKREAERLKRQQTMEDLIDLTQNLHIPKSRTPSDSEFLVSAASIIEKHLSDEDMGVALLCRELHLSRTMVDKRFKSITGDSPRAFIEEIRLRQAARLVRESDLNISEIAYEMGYSSPKYFSIRFKNKFGVSPLSYRKK